MTLMVLFNSSMEAVVFLQMLHFFGNSRQIGNDIIDLCSCVVAGISISTGLFWHLWNGHLPFHIYKLALVI